MEVKTLNILSWKMISKRCIHKTAKQPLFILFCRYGYYYFQSWSVRDFSFDIRQRYREIAIRKVNGASAKDLYRLLFRKYITVLIIAFIIAIPLAYYLINTYTQDFAVRAPVSIDIFIISLLLVIIISLGTLAYQIQKAAYINPTQIMKTE